MTYSPRLSLSRLIQTCVCAVALASCSGDAVDDLAVSPDVAQALPDSGPQLILQPDESLIGPVDGAVLRVPFEGTYEPGAEGFSFTFDAVEVENAVIGDLRTSQQALWCTGQLQVVNDGRTGSGPPNTTELISAAVATYGDCDFGTYPDGTPTDISYANLSDTDGALCSDVTFRSFYNTPISDLYAWIYQVNPTDNNAYRWDSRVLYGLGNGARPPEPSDPGAPSDNRGGLFYYGDVAADNPAERSAGLFDNAVTVQWVFRYPVDNAPFVFRGELVARVTEICNGVDDDCDGRVDEGLGCLPAATACVDDDDCVAPLRCLENVGNGRTTCGGELLPEDCDGTVDSNGDGRIGCQDPQCSGIGDCPDFSCVQGNFGGDLSGFDGDYLWTGTVAQGAASDWGIPALEPTRCGSRFPGADNGFMWTAPTDGTYTISSAGSTYDTALIAVQGECPVDYGTAFANGNAVCSDSAVGVSEEELVLHATAGESWFIIVDSAIPPSISLGRGGYAVSIFKAPVCGDGFRDATNRFLNVSLNEACDTAGDSVNCDADCTTRVCNDGYINTAFEGCEDGNVVAGDGCSVLCTVEPGYECDENGCGEICGDGALVDGGVQVCDDRNEIGGDGCTADCLGIETGWTCVPGFACEEICGDALVVGSEVCDSPGAPGCVDCVGVLGGYRCPPGGGDCVNIDECAEGLDECDPNASCNDTDGSFTCTCLSGYEGPGVTCADIDECLAAPCDANAVCTNDDGGFACDCAAGYAGNGFTCADINECDANPCDPLTACTNVAGSFSCSACPAGYSGTGLGGCSALSCALPALPPNAARTDSSPSTVLGSTLTWACASGYTPTSGSSSRTCVPGGPTGVQFDGTPLVCDRVTCPAPPAISSATVVPPSGSVRFGDAVGYNCNAGYQLIGAPSLSVTCQANASYSAPTGSCQIRDCGPLSAPSNGTLGAGATTAGSVRGFTCDTGYTLQGAASLTCRDDGTWSAPAPVCSINTCPQPAALANSSLSGGPYSYTFGETLTYSCSPGYVSSGAVQRTCQANGTYSAATSTCERRDCGPLASPTNGSAVTAGTLFGDGATYSCNVGYVRSGAATSTCQSNGTWSGPAPVCNIYDCGAPAVPVNGTIASQTGTTYNSSVTYACNSGYERTAGDPGLTCSASGWIGIVPTCERVTCPILSSGPQAAANATIVAGGAGPYRYQDVVNYQCDTGFYQASGNLTRTCQANATWSGTRPVCQAITCAAPGVPLNASVVTPATVPATFGYNQAITFQCNNGYDPVGSQTLTCTGAASNGGFDFPLPTCNPGDCGSLPPVLNASQSPTILDSQLGASVTYTCSPGYSLTSGNSTRTCSATGVGSERAWTGTAPTCSPVSCGALATPTSQVLVGGPYSNTFGETRSYQCATGYRLATGTNTSTLSRTCGLHPTDPLLGQWGAAANTCVPVDCGALSTPANGTATGSGTTYASNRVFSCNSGYILSGTASRTCGADGQWTGTPVTCGAASCGGLGNPSNGLVTTSGTTTGATASYTCNAGYEPGTGNASRTCTGTGPGTSAWSGSAMTCVPRSCGNVPALTNGSVAYTGGNTLGGTANYSCTTAGYYLVGNASRACQISGGGPGVAWTGSAPTCAPITCAAANAVANGSVSAPTTTFGSTATHSCATNYRPRSGSSTTQTCSADAGSSTGGSWSWTGTALTCDPLPCAAPPGISNGAPGTPTGLVAGSTVSYSCTTAGYVLSGGATATCNDTGGSSGAWQNVPSCAPVNCGSPSTGLVPNATRGTVGTTTLNSTVTYTCATNFNTTGSPGGSSSVTATCGTAGTWTPNVAQCVPISCGAPPAAPNATVSGSAVNAPSSVTYTCAAGFSANGVYNGSRTFTNTCGAGGWSAPAPAGCARYTCLPYTPTTGVGVAYSPVGRLWAGDSAALSCLSGYYTASTTGSNLTCAASTGTYGTSTFTCDQVLCPALAAPANGNAVSYNQGAVGGQYPVGTTASFGCTTGYSLSSATTRVCTQVPGSAVGSWSNTSPVCNNINDCTAGRCTGTGNTCVDLVNGYRCECSTASGYNVNTATYTNPTNGSVTCTPDCGDGRLIAGEPCDASVAGQPGNNVVPLCEASSCSYCRDTAGVCSIATVGANACTNGVNDDSGPAPDQGTDCFDRDCAGVQGCPDWDCGSAMTEYIAGATGNVSRSITGRVNDNTGWNREDYGFAWRADFNGQVTMQTCGSGFDTRLAVWSGAVCSYSGSTGSIVYNDDTTSCSGGSNANYGSRVTFNVTNGALYTVLVDGTDGYYQNDNFVLNIASSCGNGSQQTNEACDDGNRNNGDGCSSACIVESGWECFGFGANTCGQLRFDYTLPINQGFSYSNTPKDYYIGVANCGTVIRMESILDLYHACRDDVEIDFYNPAGTEWGAKGTSYVAFCDRPWSDPTYTTNNEFRGTNGNGTWRFRLDDDYSGDDGTIYSWRLRLWCR